jgi:hypothetical protein
MSLYKQFKTDKNVEKEGIVLNYGKNSKGEDIEIRIARAGGANVQYAKLLEVKTKPYRRQIQNETLDNDVAEKITKEVYAKAVVMGWTGVEDENGKPLEFSSENCIKLFDDLPDLWMDIQQQSTKAALFRADILEQDAKN